MTMGQRAARTQTRVFWRLGNKVIGGNVFPWVRLPLERLPADVVIGSLAKIRVSCT